MLRQAKTPQDRDHWMYAVSMYAAAIETNRQADEFLRGMNAIRNDSKVNNYHWENDEPKESKQYWGYVDGYVRPEQSRRQDLYGRPIIEVTDFRGLLNTSGQNRYSGIDNRSRFITDIDFA